MKCARTCVLHVSHELPQFHSVSSVFHPHIFFSSLCLLVEPSVQKFETAVNKVLQFVRLFLLEVSRFFWLHTQSYSVFCWYTIQTRTLFVYFGELLYSFLGVTKQHCAASLFFVTWWCYWYNLQHARLFVVHPAALVSPGLHHGFILTAMILCAVSHWWVMMLQFWENWFWLNLDWLISLQLQGNYINTKHLWRDILYSRNGLFKLRFLSPSLF